MFDRLTSLWPVLGLAGFVAVAGASCGRSKPPPGTTVPDAGGATDGGDGDGEAGGFTDGSAAGDGDADDGGVDGGTTHVVAVTSFGAGVSGDGFCSLDEAITAVNTQAPAADGDCPAETGDDVITLRAGDYDVAATLEVGASMRLVGAGKDATTIRFGATAAPCGFHLATDQVLVELYGITLRPADEAVAGGVAQTGVCVDSGRVRIRHARVTAFTAGGLRATAEAPLEAKLEIYNSLIDHNANPDSGGGVAFLGAGAWITVEQSSIVDNVSADLGGGVYAFGGSNANYIINSTVSGNRARRGGGVAAQILDQTYVGLVGTTVVDNVADEVGGGLHLEATSLQGHAFVNGAIIAQNTATLDPAQANLNADWNVSFSCTASLFDLRGLANRPSNWNDLCLYEVADPRLGPLMDMGGADHLPMHALLSDSPAIDSYPMEIADEIVEQRDTWNRTLGDPPIGLDPGDTAPWSIFGSTVGTNTRNDMGAFEYNPRWEAELAAFSTGVGGTAAIVTAPEGWSHGAGVQFTNAGPGPALLFQIPVPVAGMHAVSLHLGTGPDAGIVALSVSDEVDGPYTPLGQPMDTYAPIAGWRDFDVGVVDFAAAGQKFLRFDVTGKAADSTGFALSIDYLMVTKS